MCSGSWPAAALCSKFSTLSAPASSRKYAMSAKLSRTESAILGFFQRFFLFFVFRPQLPKWPFARFTFQNAPRAFDRRAGDRPEQDSLRRGLTDCLCAILDFKLLADSAWNDHLALHGERNCLCFGCVRHDFK